MCKSELLLSGQMWHPNTNVDDTTRERNGGGPHARHPALGHNQCRRSTRISRRHSHETKGETAGERGGSEMR